MAGTFVMVFQLALLWFLQTQSCQHVWTALHYLPVETLLFLLSCGGFSGSRESEQRPALQSTEQGRTGHFFLTCAVALPLALSFWQFIFPSIYCRKAFRGVLCFAQKVFISRKLQVSTLEDCWGLAAHAQCSYIPDSFILHACTEVAFYCQF